MKSKFLSFLTKGNPNNGNQTESDSMVNLIQSLFNGGKLLKHFSDFKDALKAFDDFKNKSEV